MVIFVITMAILITGGNGEGRRDMLALTKDQDTILGNGSYNLAFSLHFWQPTKKSLAFVRASRF